MASTTTFGLFLLLLKFRFYFPTSMTSSLLPRVNIFIFYFVYGKYFSLAYLGNLCSIFGAKVFRFPWSIFFFADIWRRMSRDQNWSHSHIFSQLLLLQCVIQYFTLFHIVTTSIFSQISKLIFYYWWWFNIFYYPTFLMSFWISGIGGRY